MPKTNWPLSQLLYLYTIRNTTLGRAANKRYDEPSTYLGHWRISNGSLPIPLKVSNWHPIVENKFKSFRKYYVTNSYTIQPYLPNIKLCNSFSRSIEINDMITMEMYVFGLEFKAGFHFVRELFSRLRQLIVIQTFSRNSQPTNESHKRIVLINLSNQNQHP